MSSTKTSSKSVISKELESSKNGVATKKSTTQIDEILNPSASARIKKLENFQLLAKKHDFLEQKRNHLDKFIISSDGTKEKVILKNAEGFEFEVSNSQVVEQVLEVIQKNLDQFIEKSEKEVLAFQI
jgi:hypothetical protein